MMEYRGYSTNPGNPSEEGLLYDTQAALGTLENRAYPQGRIIYFDGSLGGGVIAVLVREPPSAAAVLRSPFTELAEVGAHQLSVTAGARPAARGIPRSSPHRRDRGARSGHLGKARFCSPTTPQR
ncbi:hypothetical protein GCM10023354_17980 [Garicola koreensis]